MQRVPSKGDGSRDEKHSTYSIGNEVGKNQNASQESRKSITKNGEGVQDKLGNVNIDDTLKKISENEITTLSNTELGHTTRLSPRQAVTGVFGKRRAWFYHAVLAATSLGALK